VTPVVSCGTPKLMKVIFWDWNGTLLNDTPANVDIFNVVRLEFGYAPISVDRYRELYRHPIREMYADAGYDFSKHPFERLAERWSQAYQSNKNRPGLHEDATDVLLKLSELGSRHAILSALPHEMLTENVNQLAIGHHFEVVRGAKDHFGHSKVAEGVDLARFLNAAGEEITVVGDSSHDAEVAQELGAQCVLVSHGAESATRLLTTGFPVCGSLNEVHAHLTRSGK
jgi:phosphoglycolate phosphatase